MKTYECIAKNHVGGKPYNRIYAYCLDENGIIISLAFTRMPFVNGTEEVKDNINSERLGYNTIAAILSGQYTFDVSSKPNVATMLLVRSDLFESEDLYRIDYIGYFDSNLLGVGESSLYSLYGFSFAVNNNPYSNAPVPVLEASNVYELSYLSKRSLYNVKSDKMLGILGYPVGADSTEDQKFLATMLQNSSKVLYINLDTDVTQMTTRDFLTSELFKLLPTLTIQTEKSGTNWTVTGKCAVDGVAVPNALVYLSSTGGYLSKTKLMTDETGTYQATFIPLGLESGDSVNIQCGFRLFTGVADTDLQVE